MITSLQVRFVDDNTRKPWSPITGGSNIPAVNDFLLPAFGMALGGQTLSGLVSLPGGEVCLHFWLACALRCAVSPIPIR